MRSKLQHAILNCLILLLPTSLLAGNTAMLTSMGSNSSIGNAGPSSHALFVGDTVATQADSAATINAPGSMVLIQPDSWIHFQGNAIAMEHGDVVVTTSKGMEVRVGRFVIAPSALGPSKFEVSDSGGTLKISALQGSVTINDGINTTVLAEGQQTTRDDSELAKGKGAAPAASSSVHTRRKKLAAIILFGGAAGATAGALLATRGGSTPVSPAVP